MKILIADDHDLVRDAISAFLEHESDIEVASEADFDAALGRISADGPFHLVLLDYSMPGMNQLEGLELARNANGGAPVAIISGTATRQVAEAALAHQVGSDVERAYARSDLLERRRELVERWSTLLASN